MRAGEGDTSERIPVLLDIEDSGLRRSLLLALGRHPRLIATRSPSLARAVIADHKAPVGWPSAVVIGDAEVRRGRDIAAPADDPDLAVSLVHALAGGYRVETGHPHPADASADRVRLTVRERQVLELMASGASNKHIANALAISVHTAKFHVTAILDKLGARNRSDAVGIALRDGHVTL